MAPLAQKTYKSCVLLRRERIYVLTQLRQTSRLMPRANPELAASGRLRLHKLRLVIQCRSDLFEKDLREHRLRKTFTGETFPPSQG